MLPHVALGVKYDKILPPKTKTKIVVESRGLRNADVYRRVF